MATLVANSSFVDQIFKEIVWPARDRLMENRYFTDLRNGKLTQRRLQGFSLEHTYFNWTLLKGTAIRMLKAENLGAFKGNLSQVSGGFPGEIVIAWAGGAFFQVGRIAILAGENDILPGRRWNGELLRT